MKMIEIFENENLEEFIDYLDFDPREFIKDSIVTIEDILNLGEDFYHDGRVSLRYCDDDDSCFEINFKYIGKEVQFSQLNEDRKYFYNEKTDSFYEVESAGEF